MLASYAILRYGNEFIPPWGKYTGKTLLLYGGRVFFSSSGTKLYDTGDGVGLYRIRQYTLSTAWDISTATYDTSPEGFPAYSNAIFFSPNGMHVFISNSYSVNLIRQYTLSSAWDLLTAEEGDPLSVSYSPTFFYFSPDGFNLYCRKDDYNIVQYLLSTAWDVSTASEVQTIYMYDFTEETIRIRGIFFSTDGKKMYINNYDNNRIVQFKIATPWNISTITINSKSIKTYTGRCQGLYISPSGTRMYVNDSTTKIMYQYDIPTWPR